MTLGLTSRNRARDTKLNREVAIKVLLPAVANDPERLAASVAKRRSSPHSIIRTSRRSTAWKTPGTFLLWLKGRRSRTASRKGPCP